MILIESKINRTYVQERVLTTLLGGIPNIALGGLLTHPPAMKSSLRTLREAAKRLQFHKKPGGNQ